MAINSKELMDAYRSNYGVINVKQYGAVGDGVHDDTAAFVAAKNEAKRVADRVNFNADAHRGNVQIYVPPGTYLIRQGKALMDETMPATTMGYSVVGAGRMISRILFNPSSSGQYLFYNRDAWNQVHIADIEFYSTSGNNHFFYSYSSGRSHNMEFERCHFGGKWGYGFHLEGTNTNSEMMWLRCGFSGEWNKAFYIPASASDQMVNYDFISCQFEVAKGDFIDVQKGGSINVIGGSLLYYAGSTEGGTLFKLGVGGGDHNSGAMRFVCIGSRVELPSATSRMLECQWKSGAVTFLNVDTASQSFQADKNRVNVVFDAGGDSFPNVVFDNCVLQGRHEYRYNLSSFQRLENIAYRGCSIVQHATPQQFINLVNTSGGTNPAGIPQISFQKCSGLPGREQGKQLFDTELNWTSTTSGVAHRKVVSINTANNAFPYNSYPTEDLYLPLGAIVTKVTIFMAPGTVTAQLPGWNFNVTTSESNPTVLASADPVRGDTRNGFDTRQETFFVCDTDAKRHLVLRASAGVNQIKKGYCLIEYFG